MREATRPSPQCGLEVSEVYAYGGGEVIGARVFHDPSRCAYCQSSVREYYIASFSAPISLLQRFPWE